MRIRTTSVENWRLLEARHAPILVMLSPSMNRVVVGHNFDPDGLGMQTEARLTEVQRDSEPGLISSLASTNFSIY